MCMWSGDEGSGLSLESLQKRLSNLEHLIGFASGGDLHLVEIGGEELEISMFCWLWDAQYIQVVAYAGVELRSGGYLHLGSLDTQST